MRIILTVCSLGMFVLVSMAVGELNLPPAPYRLAVGSLWSILFALLAIAWREK